MKRGISLIAVLMFMLAATTASVVVFRMIGSENFSSGARLKATEAYQASESGVDVVQAWLSSKALEASALVTQYDKEKKPIDLTNNIINGDIVGERQQKFRAYLVGVDFRANSVLKLKFIVEGEGRDNSKVSQAVIFSTDGLYKVVVEKEDEKSSASANIPLNDYFGGDTKFDGSKEISSATINGNWGIVSNNRTGSNPGTINGDFIVTGDAVLSGNGMNVGGRMCIGGDLDVANNYGTNHDAYVGSSSKFCGQYENVYSEGDIKFHNSEKVKINGSLTLNGTLRFENEVEGRYVKKDLVILKNGAVAKAQSQQDNKRFHVCGKVWSENPNGIIENTDSYWNMTANTDYVYNRYYDIFNSNYSAYCSDAASDKRLYFKDLQQVTITKTENQGDQKTVTAEIGNIPYTRIAIETKRKIGNNWQTTDTTIIPVPYEYKTANNNYLRSDLKLDILTEPTLGNKPVGADSVKAYCKRILGDKVEGCVGPKTDNCGCGGSKYKVKDPIVHSLRAIKDSLKVWAPKSTYKYTYKDKTNKDKAIDCLQDKPIKVWSKANTENDGNGANLLTMLNACYSLMKNDKKLLYGGKDGYLIMKLEQDNTTFEIQGELEGKFIFIYEKPDGQQYVSLLGTSADTKVMLFLEGEVKSEVTGAAANCSGSYNYFIYAMKKINKVNNFSTSCPLKGHIFFSSESCAGLGEVNSGFKLESNPDILNDLVDKGVLCPAGQECPTSNSNNNPSSSSTNNPSDDETDDHFSPIASRLSVNIDSKEITKETPPNADNLKSSMLVMPRIIRLKPGQTKSPAPSLSSYYEIIPLNGAEVPTNQPTPNCAPQPAPTTNCPYSSIDLAKKGCTYTCTFPDQKISKFFVQIE